MDKMEWTTHSLSPVRRQHIEIQLSNLSCALHDVYAMDLNLYTQWTYEIVQNV